MLKFLCVLCALCGLSLSCFSLDREAFTFTKYDLDIRVETEQQRLGVRGTITLRNDSSAPLKNLSLQISSSLSWRSIRFEGNPVQFVSQSYTSDIDHTGSLSEAIVSLPREVLPAKEVELEIGYEGTISLDTTRLTRIGLPTSIASRTDWDRISSSFTALRGIGYVAWYPIATEAANLSEKNTLFDTVGRWKIREARAEMNLKLVYLGQSDKDLPRLLCNGKGTIDMYEEISRAKKIEATCSFMPLGLTVPTLAIGDYVHTDGHFADIYSLPEHKNLAGEYASSVEKVRDFVSEWFGVPRGKFVVAEVPNPDLVPFESGNLLLTAFKPDNGKQNELAAVRQLTHATVLSSRPWIGEGLTHFAQALYREQQDGRDAGIDFMKVHSEVMLATEKELASDEKSSTANSLINTWNEDLYRGKSMYVWWMLRDIAGEANLKSALASYRPEQDKEPSYLQHLIEAQSKKDLEWFFDDWVYRDRGLPDFRILTVYPRKTLKDTFLVTVTVENLGGAGAEVPVTIRFKGGESIERLLVKAKSQASVRFTTTAFPDEALVNDGSVPETDMTNNTFQVPAIPDSP